jgi:hypothetical protein
MINQLVIILDLLKDQLKKFNSFEISVSNYFSSKYHCNVVISVDFSSTLSYEFAHRSYDKVDEINRYNDITMIFGTKVIWIRFKGPIEIV